MGQQLIDAKSRVKHGEWMPWMRENLAFSEDTSENYMRLASNSERVRNSGVSSLREALKMIRPSNKGKTGSPSEPRDRWPSQEQLPFEDPDTRALAIRYLQRGQNTPDGTDFLHALESLDIASRRLDELIEAVLDVERGVCQFEDVVELARAFARPPVEKQTRRPKPTHRSQKSTAVEREPRG